MVDFITFMHGISFTLDTSGFTLGDDDDEDDDMPFFVALKAQ